MRLAFGVGLASLTTGVVTQEPEQLGEERMRQKTRPDPKVVTPKLKCIAVYRGRFKGLLFDAPGVSWVGDPTVDALRGKMVKRYAPQGELPLLAYIDTNPMLPDEVWSTDLDEYLATLDRNCQFAHIYVFDCRSNSTRRAWHSPATSAG